MNTLENDILGAKFGTKHRAELLLRVDKIEKAIKDIVWMARRYASGRMTGAPSMFNDAYDILRKEFGDDIDPKDFGDASTGTKYHDITLEHTKDHPYALDGYNDSQDHKNLPNRKFYKK